MKTKDRPEGSDGHARASDPLRLPSFHTPASTVRSAPFGVILRFNLPNYRPIPDPPPESPDTPDSPPPEHPTILTGTTKPPIDPNRRRQLAGYSLGTEFAFSILGAGAFGAAIDWWFKTTPGGLLVMLALGFIGGGYNFFRKAWALNKEGAAAFKAAHPDGLKTPDQSSKSKRQPHHGPMPQPPAPSRQNTPAGMFASQPIEFEDDDSDPGFHTPPDTEDPFHSDRSDDEDDDHDSPKERP